MGDRVLFQIVGPVNVSPVIYCHSSGGIAPDIVRRLAARMASRPGDVEYASARLVQECATDSGSLGFGLWNATKRLTKEDSHGDAGVVLIDCNTWRCECFGGYLITGDDGFPMLAL